MSGMHAREQATDLKLMLPRALHREHIPEVAERWYVYDKTDGTRVVLAVGNWGVVEFERNGQSRHLDTSALTHGVLMIEAERSDDTYYLFDIFYGKLGDGLTYVNTYTCLAKRIDFLCYTAWGLLHGIRRNVQMVLKKPLSTKELCENLVDAGGDRLFFRRDRLVPIDGLVFGNPIARYGTAYNVSQEDAVLTGAQMPVTQW